MATSKARKTGQSSEEPLAAEEQAFRQKRAQLLRRYAGQYIALYQGQVVGHGADDEELTGQMCEKVGDGPFYIAKVEQAPSIYELPSYEVVR